jgi:hypothetical protein
MIFTGVKMPDEPECVALLKYAIYEIIRSRPRDIINRAAPPAPGEVRLSEES